MTPSRLEYRVGHSPKAMAQLGGSGEEKDLNEYTNDKGDRYGP